MEPSRLDTRGGDCASTPEPSTSGATGSPESWTTEHTISPRGSTVRPSTSATRGSVSARKSTPKPSKSATRARPRGSKLRKKTKRTAATVRSKDDESKEYNRLRRDYRALQQKLRRQDRQLEKLHQEARILVLSEQVELDMLKILRLKRLITEEQYELLEHNFGDFTREYFDKEDLINALCQDTSEEESEESEEDELAAKFDVELANQVLIWIKDTINSNLAADENPVDYNTSGEMTNFAEVLNDGVVLARFCNALMPGTIPKSRYSKGVKMAFKKMELIGNFIDGIKKFGVSEEEAFATVDLYEEQNLVQVLTCLQSAGRKAKAKGLPGLGPKEAESNYREFTEDQLKAGQNVIGLQMGTNKGASQSGMAFGKTRMIID